jgi:hypothetical protein
MHPIEMCWAVVKGHVAANNNEFKMAKVKALLEDGFDKVNQKTMSGILKKISSQEDIYWEEDEKYFNEVKNLDDIDLTLDAEED